MNVALMDLLAFGLLAAVWAVIFVVAYAVWRCLYRDLPEGDPLQRGL